MDQIKKIREKLDADEKAFITRAVFEMLIEKFAPSNKDGKR